MACQGSHGSAGRFTVAGGRRPAALPSPASGRPRWLAAAALLALVLPLAGCDGTPALDEVRSEIESALPGIDLVPEDSLHLGRVSLGLVHWIVGRDDDDEQVAGGDGSADREGARLVRAIHRLDLATFRVRSMPQSAGDSWSPELARRLGAAGWSLVVHAAEPGEQTWVFYRGDGDGAITVLYVVSLERGELSLIRLGGRFDQALARAVARQPKRVMPAKAGSPAPPATVETAGGAAAPAT
jgi:hypothetical protein